MPGQPAARIDDLIDHSGAMAGVVIGAALGVGLGALTVLTGGSALVIVAAMASTGAGLGLAGGGIGELVFPRQITGRITTGSGNVFIGGRSRKAARAGLDIAACAGPLFDFSHNTRLIAQGSDGVFINGEMAARRADRLTCGARIALGCDSVLMGGGPATVAGLAIEGEIPSWFAIPLKCLMYGGAVVMTGGLILEVGAAATLFGLAGSLIGGKTVGWLGKELGGEIGKQLGNEELGKRVGETVGELIGAFLGGYAGSKAAPEPPVIEPPLPQGSPQVPEGVKAGMKSAWENSNSDSFVGRHEEGGFIVRNPDGTLSAEPCPPGTRSGYQYPTPEPGMTYNGKPIEGTYHTHPNPKVDALGRAHRQGPSPQDVELAKQCPGDSYVVSDDNVYRVGPDGNTTLVGPRDEVLR
jgi:uncharacterized Zn-binding protein involved in type VI secretion